MFAQCRRESVSKGGKPFCDENQPSRLTCVYLRSLGSVKRSNLIYPPLAPMFWSRPHRHLGLLEAVTIWVQLNPTCTCTSLPLRISRVDKNQRPWK